MNQRVVSSRFPYVPLHLSVRGRSEVVQALLDTGLDGNIAVPHTFIDEGEPPDFYIHCALTDGSEVVAPAYLSEVRLDTIDRFPVMITLLGDEPPAGRGVTDRFTVILDHGQQLIVDP